MVNKPRVETNLVFAMYNCGLCSQLVFQQSPHPKENGR